MDYSCTLWDATAMVWFIVAKTAEWCFYNTHHCKHWVVWHALYIIFAHLLIWIFHAFPPVNCIFLVLLVISLSTSKIPLLLHLYPYLHLSQWILKSSIRQQNDWALTLTFQRSCNWYTLDCGMYFFIDRESPSLSLWCIQYLTCIISAVPPIYMDTLPIESHPLHLTHITGNIRLFGMGNWASFLWPGLHDFQSGRWPFVLIHVPKKRMFSLYVPRALHIDTITKAICHFPA